MKHASLLSFASLASLATLASVAALSSVACSSSSSSPSVAQDPPLPPGVSLVTFTMHSTVAPSSEAHTCQLVKLPASVGSTSFLVGGKHVYTVGSHHMILFRTDLASIAPGQETPQDCYEGPGGSMMGHIRGVVYGAQTPTAESTFPSGVGLPFVNEEVFLMQTHYLNAGDKPLEANVKVDLRVSDGTGITTRAGVFFFYDPFIVVPAGVKGAPATMSCLVRNDVTLLSASSHYHKRGYDYAAYLDPASGPASSTPFYTSNDWDHPTTLASTMNVAAGSRIRFRCAYDNTRGTKDYYQGQSAENDEMCMFIGTYYPEIGEKDDFCMTAPTSFGAGTQTCAQTLNCFKACPPGSVGSLGSVRGVMNGVDPCVQKCFTASCPGATAKMTALRACTGSKCTTECADSGSAACASCAQSNCADETGACFTDPCD